MEQKPHILVVEDSPNWREMFGFLLEGAGYTVDLAVTMNEGIKKLDENAYQLAIVDLQLSTPEEIDSVGLGTIILDRLAHSRPKIPSIAVTGWDRVSPGTPRKLFKNHDINDFFWKSEFDADEFRQAAAECLRVSRLGKPETIAKGKNVNCVFLAHPYEQSSFDLFKNGLGDLFHTYGYKILHPSDAPPGKRLWHQIATDIKRSAWGLYEISKANSSIYFELGFALGEKKPCLILQNTPKKQHKGGAVIPNSWITSYESREGLREITQRFLTTESRETAKPPKMKGSRSISRLSPDSLTALIVVADDPKQEVFLRSMLAQHIIGYRFKPDVLYLNNSPNTQELINHIANTDLVIGNLAKIDQTEMRQKNANLAFILGLSICLGLPTVIMQESPIDTQYDFASILLTYEKPDDIEGLLWEWISKSQYSTLTIKENFSYETNEKIDDLISQVSSLQQALEDFKAGQSTEKIRTNLSNAAVSMNWGEKVMGMIQNYRGTIFSLVFEISMNILLSR